MTLYEFRMHWRRKGMLAVTAVVIFSAIAGVLSGGFNSNQVADAQARLAAQGLSTDTLMTTLTSIVLMMTWISMMPGLFFILPLVSCDAAALDQQYGVSDLLNGLPLPSSVYLTGKLFGVWAAGLVSALISMLVVTVIWRFAVGVFDLRLYLGLWVVGALSAVILNGGFGLLVGATQSSRRRALLFTLAMFWLPVLLTSTGKAAFPFAIYLDASRNPLLLYYEEKFSDMFAGLSASFDLISPQVVTTIGVGLAELVIIGIGVWGWRRWQENKQ
jgi:hypothetical protein